MLNTYFYIRYQEGRFAYRWLHAVPRVGEICVFDEVRYQVERVEWCLDTDATTPGDQRVNIEIVLEKR